MRQLAIELLNDDDGHGISEKAWGILKTKLEEEGGNEDIIRAVRHKDDRVYLFLSDAVGRKGLGKWCE